MFDNCSVDIGKPTPACAPSCYQPLWRTDATHADGSHRDSAGASVCGHRAPGSSRARNLTRNFATCTITPALPAPTATHCDCMHRRSWGALGSWKSWKSWGAWGAFWSCRTDKLASYKNIASVRDAKESSSARSNQVPSGSVMKFSSCSRLGLGYAPHPHVAMTLPFDPSLGIADTNNATALLGVALDARAAFADTYDAAAGRRLAKYPIAVRRIVPKHTGDHLACRGGRHRRLRRNLYRQCATYHESDENQAGDAVSVHYPTPFLYVMRACRCRRTTPACLFPSC